MQALEDEIKELAYDEYQARQYDEISPDGLESRSAKLRIGGRARWESGRWVPQPYPGFAMQAMARSSSNRDALCLDLQDIQHQVVSLLDQPGALYPLPAASFHQTIANAFSADRLQRRVIDAGHYEDFPEIVARAITSWQADGNGRPPAMRLVGISLFRTALGLLGVFEKDADFARVLAFRDHFYGSPELAKIGLKRTRPFIGHVTLAYIEAQLADEQRRRLVDGISRINTHLRKDSLVMEMPQAELHRYDNLSAFIPDPAYPQAKL